MHARVVFSLFVLTHVPWRTVLSVSLAQSVPDRIQAVVGSCVVIPCSFTPTAPRPPAAKKERVDVCLRFRGGGRFFPLLSTAFDSQNKDRVSVEFLGRTSLLGQITDGDCSVKIEKVRRDDPQMFEVALKKGDNLLWGKPKSFHLDIIDPPEPPIISGMLSATEGQPVTVNCTVSFYCPTNPPILEWKWDRGAQLNFTEFQEVQTLSPDSNRQILLSSISFTASQTVKPRLRCEVRRPRAKTLTAIRDLHVTFPPKDVKIEVQTLEVHEGGSALLVCSCKADPPASEYHWSYIQHGHTVHIHHHLRSVRLFNVTRDMRVHCSAMNLIGRGDSQPTQLNIQYKPSILQLSSSCTMETSTVLCRCLVDSNPKPAITWSVNGSVPSDNFNVSVTSESNTLTASLRGNMDTPLQIICFALNYLGNDSMVLLQGVEEEVPFWLLVVPAVAVCLIVFFFSLLVCCYRRKSERHVRHPAMFPEGLSIYRERMPLYINCTEVTHVYTNGSYQLVYQNSTPLFVRSKQVSPMARRGGAKRRVRETERMTGEAGREVRETREVQSSDGADPETAIYLEIL